LDDSFNKNQSGGNIKSDYSGGQRRPGHRSFRPMGSRFIGSSLKSVISPICKKYGLASADLVLEWPKVVGEEVAKHCRVEKVIFPDGAKFNGCLYLQTSSVMAAAMNYRSEAIIERVNQYYGYRAVRTIKFFHKPVKLQHPLSSSHENLTREVKVQDLPHRWTEELNNVQDENLKEALFQLAQCIDPT